jgi:hypothetical protein
VDIGVGLTCQQAIRKVRHLIASGDPQGAITYWRSARPLLWETLTADELHIVGELLSGADRMVRYAAEEAAEARARDEAAALSPTSAS